MISKGEEEKGKGRERERGSRRAERRGTAGRMTGWERHSHHAIPRVQVGKVRVQVLGTRGHTFTKKNPTVVERLSVSKGETVMKGKETGLGEFVRSTSTPH